MSAGLKRKFQPPMKRDGGGGGNGNNNCGQNSGNGVHKSYNSSNRHASGGGGGGSGGNANNEDEELPEELKGLDKELVEKINNEIVDTGEQVTFDDIAGLKHAKETVNEIVIMPMIRPDLFTGLRACPKGLLLFGPPGTGTAATFISFTPSSSFPLFYSYLLVILRNNAGKTLIGKAIAHESRATFFSISSSSLTSKWIGEGEKLVRTLFAVASYRAPSVVFIDEVDSMLTQRKADENEASRRIKTEFLVQLDGAGNGRKGQVLVIGATNRPQELDDAARRRFVKRLYIPLPDQDGREALISNLLKKNDHTLTAAQLAQLAKDSEGFSGADLKILCTEAAMGPLRKFGARAVEMNPRDVPPISYKNFRQALRQVNPSVAQSDLASHIEWNNTYGSKAGRRSDDSSEDSDMESDTGNVDER
jgi:SpoVK/Ycf46/Vps4 family AAA+-type ATPase